MARLVIVRSEQSSGEHLLVRPARLRERLSARVRVHRLNAELARGIAPEARAALALRAEALGDPSSRRTLARQLRRVLEDARRGNPPLCVRVPLRRRAVLAAAEELDELAERLTAPGPLCAQGIAQAHLLLSDGASPIYWHRAGEDVRTRVLRALANLEPRFQW